MRLNLHHPHNPDAESPDVWENLIPPPLGIGDITTGKSPVLLGTAGESIGLGDGEGTGKEGIKGQKNPLR